MLIKTILKKGQETFENIADARFENDTYIYKENDLDVSIKIDNNVIMTRENKDYKMRFVFIDGNKTHNELLLKEDNISLDIEINTKEILIKENYLEIRYKMNDEVCIFTLGGVKL